MLDPEEVMMRKRIVVVLAALLLIGGGSVVAVAQAANSTDTTTSDSQVTDTKVPEGPLSEVLDELVSRGVITVDQATAITDAVAAKRQELAAARHQRVQERRDRLSQIRGFLDDDVITSDELSQLPGDSPLRDPSGPLADALQDGQITRDELKDARIFLRGFRRGHRLGQFQGSTSGP